MRGYAEKLSHFSQQQALVVILHKWGQLGALSSTDPPHEGNCMCEPGEMRIELWLNNKYLLFQVIEFGVIYYVTVDYG